MNSNNCEIGPGPIGSTLISAALAVSFLLFAYVEPSIWKYLWAVGSIILFLFFLRALLWPSRR